jgi:hypothetical protein
MTDGFFFELLALCSTAGGLVLLGLSSLALGGRGFGVRLAVAGGAAAAAAGVPFVLGYPASAALPAAVVGMVGLITAVLGSTRSNVWIAAGVRWLGRSGVQAAGLCVAGGILLVASLGRYDDGFEAAIDADMAFMAEVSWKPPLEASASQSAVTDAGRTVNLWQPRETRPAAEVQATERGVLGRMPFAERIIRVGPASDTCNCHGYVFTAGRFWLDPEDVEHILADNGYQPVSLPRTGDLVIYREGGRIGHTAVVRTAAPGGPVLVEGKWGWMGVFMHAPDASCYGANLTYYRSPRDGHLLFGLADRPIGAKSDAVGAGE